MLNIQFNWTIFSNVMMVGLPTILAYYIGKKIERMDTLSHMSAIVAMLERMKQEEQIPKDLPGFENGAMYVILSLTYRTEEERLKLVEIAENDPVLKQKLDKLEQDDNNKDIPEA